MDLCPKVVFLLENNFHKEFIQINGGKNQLYVLLTLTKCKISTISFILWMPKGAHDIFALVIKILKVN
jgi:hypothetical protein